MLDLIDIIPKIVVATICGIIIGFERELKQKTAGIRTNVLVCVGSCLFASIPYLIISHYKIDSIDPTRVIGQIITGVGFLGAGVIYKQDSKVIGVTSAALIWFVSAIGAIAGLGFYIPAIGITIGLLCTILTLQWWERHIGIWEINNLKLIGLKINNKYYGFIRFKFKIIIEK